MNKKAAIIAGVAIVGLLGAFTLGGKDKAQETEVKGTEIVAVQDENGTIEVTKNPERVVTFDYGTLDILDNMGVDVVGLPKGSLPEYLSKYKEDKYSDLGGLKEPDFEAINELNPDLIIISGRQADMYDKFAEIATTVYLSVDGSDYLNDFSRNLDVLGKIFGKEDFVKENLDNLTKQMDEVKAMAQAKALFDNDLIKSTDAYKNDKIVYLDSAAWYVVAGGLDSTQTMINNVKDALK